MRWLFFLSLCVLGTAVLHAESASPVRYETTAQLMGCTFGIAAYGSDRDTLAKSAEKAFDEARRIESWLSDYRPDSELSRLNQTAADKPVRASSEFFDLLTRASEYSRASEGAFDMTVGPLVRAWGFHGGEGRVPGVEELEKARASVGYLLVKLDPAARTVRFERPGMQLDPGAIGKGYAIDRMADVLKTEGITSVLVNACQSSIFGLGAPPDDSKGWAIEIDQPNGDTPETVHLKNESLSTSGSQEKFFEVNGRTYSHILDPRTGSPAEGITAISVIARTGTDADVWSTAVFVNGLDWTYKKAPAGLKIYGCPAEGPCRWVK